MTSGARTTVSPSMVKLADDRVAWFVAVLWVTGLLKIFGALICIGLTSGAEDASALLWCFVAAAPRGWGTYGDGGVRLAVRRPFWSSRGYALSLGCRGDGVARVGGLLMVHEHVRVAFVVRLHVRP